MTEQWAYDRIFEALVRELVESRAASVEMASTARREMADIKKEEESVGKAAEGRADDDRADFAQTLDAARQRSADADKEIAYDSADPAQDHQADLIARYLVSLGYAEMRTDEEPKGHAIYRVRIFWDKLKRWQEPSD